MEYFTGIDLHKTFVLLTTIDKDGNLVTRRRLHNDDEKIIQYFDALQGVHHAVVESCVGWYWLRDLLTSHAVDLVMAHPLLVKAIAYAKVKTDTVDSATLASLHRVDLIPKAHMINPDRRALRDLVRRRHRLVNERTRMLNASQGVLQAVHRTVEELEPADSINYNSLLAIINSLSAQITHVEKEAARVLANDPEYLLIQTIPGVGPVHAAEIILETDGISRFATEKKYFSYARVVPGCHNSGGNVRSKRSKQGNVHLRRALGDAAVHAVRLYPEFKQVFDRLRRRHPEAQAWALLAKQIARGVYHVLSKVEPYYGLQGKPLGKRKASEAGALRKLSLTKSAAGINQQSG